MANFSLNAVINQGNDPSKPLMLYLIVIFSIFIAIVSIWYGGKEAKLRKSTVELLTRHVEKLELHINPSRTSSLLTAKGDTAERDKR